MTLSGGVSDIMQSATKCRFEVSRVKLDVPGHLGALQYATVLCLMTGRLA